MTILLMMSDHPGDGVRPYPGSGSDHSDDGGWPSLAWQVTKFWMVDDPPGDGVRQSWGWSVTIL